MLDVVYDPWPTPLASAAAQAGIVVVSGFDLLLHQAARQVELMTGREPAPLEPMRAAGHSELARRAALPARQASPGHASRTQRSAADSGRRLPSRYATPAPRHAGATSPRELNRQ